MAAQMSRNDRFIPSGVLEQLFGRPRMPTAMHSDIYTKLFLTNELQEQSEERYEDEED